MRRDHNTATLLLADQASAMLHSLARLCRPTRVGAGCRCPAAQAVVVTHTSPSKPLLCTSLVGKRRMMSALKEVPADVDSLEDHNSIEDTAAGTGAVEAVPIDVDPSQYQHQLQSKLRKLRALFSAADSGVSLPEDIKVHESQPIHYRMRAQFAVYHTGDELQYVMFRPAAPPAETNALSSSLAEGAGTSTVAAAASDSAQLGTSAPLVGSATTSQKSQSRKRKCRSNEKPRRERVHVAAFPVGSRLMNDLMPLVLKACQASPALSNRLFQVNFQTTLSGEAMVTLVHHKVLGDDWKAAAAKLRQDLADACLGGNLDALQLIGRSRGQLVELGRAFVLEKLTVNGQQYTYKQVEGAFSQPNAGVAEQMLAWAQNVTQRAADTSLAAVAGNPVPAPAGAAPAAKAGVPAATEGSNTEHDTIAASANASSSTGANDLLELYCGNGNFTVPLAANFRRVIATEASKSSVEAAKYNFNANGVTNILVARMSSEEFAETWRTKGTRTRLKGLSWDDVHFSTILVDPPRAGLDDFTIELLRDFPCIVYVSCNPETLQPNLAALSSTHELRHFAIFDQFPYSHHLECGAYLVRRQ